MTKLKHGRATALSRTPPFGRCDAFSQPRRSVPAAGFRRQIGPENVSQALTLPVWNPLRNQLARCSEVPCVKESGTT